MAFRLSALNFSLLSTVLRFAGEQHQGMLPLWGVLPLSYRRRMLTKQKPTKSVGSSVAEEVDTWQHLSGATEPDIALLFCRYRASSQLCRQKTCLWFPQLDTAGRKITGELAHSICDTN